MLLLCSLDGRSFHTDGADERKLRWPKRTEHERGTTMSPWSADRSHARAPTVWTGTRTSSNYPGPWPRTQSNAIRATLNRMHCGTSSQCNQQSIIYNRESFGNWPTTLQHQLSLYAPIRALRSSTSKLLQVPRTNLRFGSRSFCASAPTLWNSLPHSVHFYKSLATFKWHSTPLHYPSTSGSVLILALYKFTYLLSYWLTYLYVV